MTLSQSALRNSPFRFTKAESDNTTPPGRHETSSEEPRMNRFKTSKYKNTTPKISKKDVSSVFDESVKQAVCFIYWLKIGCIEKKPRLYLKRSPDPSRTSLHSMKWVPSRHYVVSYVFKAGGLGFSRSVSGRSASHVWRMSYRLTSSYVAKLNYIWTFHTHAASTMDGTVDQKPWCCLCTQTWF